ncbi:acyl-CoA dehydrogenase family protein [Paracoccus sp. MBLB3053]|uniref:Acyl-CoA dehydrogenase family protein n=1 Tax=Paracoccus aurantius TaxID=3073814 RepID=A0ABU2HWD3_9RHOB|nr:acyl-CoA dehydrogenase family protein [Paracoccus sp. MBLB3053]MDS9469362.1 acyl-CoA dehydrogenase family protein [Paracoccus sp. MBLB3053]
MRSIEAQSELGTHRVENQPSERDDADLMNDDPAIQESLAELDDETRRRLGNYGRAIGSRDMRWSAREANRHGPELFLFDRAGRRLDEVRFHPAYHRFMTMSRSAGYSSIAWEGTPRGHSAHALMVYMASQVEPGHCCPLTMTYAAIPALAKSDDSKILAWRDKLLRPSYDPSVAPLASKTGATMGMALTEKQGGSDVRANTTWAQRDGHGWRLTGHKWFCSAPMSDGFLTLAQTESGLTCFLVPRWLEGERNGIRLLRLKDKLGNRSNASAEIEYQQALAWQVGDVGQGVQAVIEMIHHTRLDTAIAPVGLMRAALAEAHHWVSHRSAFQRRLIDQPLMRNVLCDLALDLEGSLALGMRIARAFDGTSAEERAFARIGVALAKYLSNKLCPIVIGEAMEILGGMGYVEDTPLPMLYREAPLNGIWEGSGNVICLDALRTLEKLPLAKEMIEMEFEAAAGQDAMFRRALQDYWRDWPSVPEAGQARAFVEKTALLLSAAALIQSAPEGITEEYVRTRLSEPRGRMPGAVRLADSAKILTRLARP